MRTCATPPILHCIYFYDIVQSLTFCCYKRRPAYTSCVRVAFDKFYIHIYNNFYILHCIINLLHFYEIVMLKHEPDDWRRNFIMWNDTKLQIVVLYSQITLILCHILFIGFRGILIVVMQKANLIKVSIRGI